MKKILGILFALIMPIAISAENKISMVTYFPVPYVAYSKINVGKQLDVGLTSSCEMNLGCAESGAAGNRPLNVSTANLNMGELDLNTGIAAQSTDVSLGSGTGIAQLDFESSVRIGTMNNGYSMEVDEMSVDTLKLFPSRIKNEFPSCAATGASGAPQVSWQKLQLKGKEEVFLVCGAPKEETPNCTGVKSKWDGTRCVCPGENDYFVKSTHACCSESTPKTNRQCWLPTKATWNFGVGHDRTTTDSCWRISTCNNLNGVSECPGLRTNYTGKPNYFERIDPSIENGQKCSAPAQCIYRCICDEGIISMDIAACFDQGYTRRWNPATDKNY